MAAGSLGDLSASSRTSGHLFDEPPEPGRPRPATATRRSRCRKRPRPASGRDLYDDLAAKALGSLSQVRDDVLLQEGSEASQRRLPVCLSVPAPDGHHFVVARADEIHAAKAGAPLNDRWSLLLDALH